MATVGELFGPVRKLHANPRRGAGCCATCMTFVEPAYRRCFLCNSNQRWLAAVLPISYAERGGQLQPEPRGLQTLVARERRAHPPATRGRAVATSYSATSPGQRGAHVDGDAIGFDLSSRAARVPRGRLREGPQPGPDGIGGRQRLDAIRTQFAPFFDREREIVRARQSSAQQHSARALGWGIGGLSVVLVVTLGLGGYLLRGRWRSSDDT